MQCKANTVVCDGCYSYGAYRVENSGVYLKHAALVNVPKQIKASAKKRELQIQFSYLEQNYFVSQGAVIA